MVRSAAGIAAALALAIPAWAAKGPGVRFTHVPGRVVAGSSATVTVKAPGTGRCALTVRYADGTTEKALGSAPLLSGKATWTWKVADTTAAGKAAAKVVCGKAKAARTMLIVGSLIPPRIVVVKDGFSTRPKSPGTKLSYGLVLRNTSPNADALNVYVLINFVLADNKALGTVTQSVGRIGAGSTFDLGGSTTFPGLAPIARLEVVLQVGGHERKSTRLPAVANVVVEPSTYDAGWVGDVAGELIDDDPPWILNRAQMWAVVFDAAGNVLGGGQGFAGARLLPGTREVFKLSQGFDAIPVDKAASAAVSSVPQYSTS